jgi:hypothetical protein
MTPPKSNITDSIIDDLSIEEGRLPGMGKVSQLGASGSLRSLTRT